MIRRTTTSLVLRTSIWAVIALVCASTIRNTSRDVIRYRQAIASDETLAGELSAINVALRESRLRLDSLRKIAAMPAVPWSLESLRQRAIQAELRLVRIEPGRGQSRAGSNPVIVVALEGDLFAAMLFLHGLELSIPRNTITAVSLAPKSEAGTTVVLSLDMRFAGQ